MRSRWALLVGVLQLAVLAYMAGEREWILRTGQNVFLRTAPVDPRDPMRGDYVRLGFETATIPKDLCRDGVAAWLNLPLSEHYKLHDKPVYVSVRLDQYGIAEVIAASDRPPEALYIRGRVVTVDVQNIRVRYGLEAMFTEQHKAREFEQQQARHPGVPLDIQAAVGRSGIAVLKSYRWEPLGITVTEDRPPASASRPPGVRTATPRRRVPAGVTVELKNHSDKPVAIVTRPNGTFRLLTTDWSRPNSAFEWVGAHDSIPPPRPEDVRVLQPGEAHREHIDFSSPRWFLRPKSNPEVPVPWNEVTNSWEMSPRLEYVAPSSDECAGLPHAESVYHARLRSAPVRPLWSD